MVKFDRLYSSNSVKKKKGGKKMKTNGKGESRGKGGGGWKERDERTTMVARARTGTLFFADIVWIEEAIWAKGQITSGHRP